MVVPTQFLELKELLVVLEERLPQMDVWQCLAYGLSDGAFRLWVPCGKRYATITQPNLGNLRDALTPLAMWSLVLM